MWKLKELFIVPQVFIISQADRNDHLISVYFSYIPVFGLKD